MSAHHDPEFSGKGRWTLTSFTRIEDVKYDSTRGIISPNQRIGLFLVICVAVNG